MESYPSELDGGVTAQINMTMPKPFEENTILESQILAIKQAKHYIFIEDQYFRMPLINKSISVRMTQEPELRLIVITQPVGEWTDLGCFWTATSYKFFMDNFSSRVEFFQLKSFDYTYPNHDCEGTFTDTSCYGDEMEGYFKEFYVHSKMLIIDDKYMSIGSANKNNRGYLYEAEMNVAILDKVWVKEQRKIIFANILGVENYSDVESYDAEDFGEMFNRLKEIAIYNQNAYENWDGWDDNNGSDHMDIDLDIDYTAVSKENALPNEYKAKGFLYPLEFTEPSNCLIEDIGEDAAK
jgi:phosphatidylserine/phosphatidylglycerophosphate/cardiolipin synthase-like enzyme